MIMTMNIYITQENETSLRNYNGSMSGLINDLLSQYFDQPTSLRSDTPNTITPRPLSEVLVEEEDLYLGYKIHRITGNVVDTINREPIEDADKEMVDYLKRNNRYV